MIMNRESQGEYEIVRSVRQLVKGEAKPRYISGPRRIPHLYYYY